MTGADTERAELAELVRELGVVHGRVTLASGAEADYYASPCTTGRRRWSGA